jgi:hypothetical protein
MSDVQAGFYKGRGIAGSEQYGVAGTGTDQIAVDVDVPSVGRALTVFLYFSDGAAPYAIEKLRAMGWQGNDLANLVGIDANEVDVSVKYKEYQGKQRIEVDVVAGGGGRVKLETTMSHAQKAAFAARMKPFVVGANNLGASTQRPAPARAPAQRREGAYDPGPPPDDDLPF